LLYTPMIYRVASRKSGKGLSVSTWLLKMACYSSTDIYNFQHGYPISSYFETITLFVQALVMLALVCYFERLTWPALAASSGAAIIGLAVSSDETFVVTAAQVTASAAGSGAVVPQILENFRRRGSGEFSVVTATLLTLGNALRWWTTQELTHDPLLLAGFAIGFGANALLLSQILFYGTMREGKSLLQLYTSDFTSNDS